MPNDNAEVIQLITEMKESLERQIDGFEQRVNSRFDVLESRIELHAGLLCSDQTNLGAAE